MCAEAILFFDSSLAKEAGYRRKRGGHLFSKMRYLSAQFDAYLADDLWRRNARHSNTMATRLAAGLSAISGVEFAYPVEANELFVRMPAFARITRLLQRDMQTQHLRSRSALPPSASPSYLNAVRCAAKDRRRGRRQTAPKDSASWKIDVHPVCGDIPPPSLS